MAIVKAPNRQIVLDTETTGLETADGHRVIEIGCVELLNRRLTHNHFHRYLQPDRAIDPAAVEVHGITSEFLADKPRFADVADDFLGFIQGAELIIHNAAFDVGFIDHELRITGLKQRTAELCRVFDTLELARRLHPGQRNSLDALCKRYDIDNSQRTLHGALLDAEILADVYLAMTREQVALSLETEIVQTEAKAENVAHLSSDRPPLRIIRATENERAAHARYLDALDNSSSGQCVWRRAD